MKYWKDEPTVGINPGEGFIHNDARYGDVHNTDQSMIMPENHGPSYKSHRPARLSKT